MSDHPPTAYTPSCGTSPVAAYIRVPFRCRLLKAAGVLGGAITTADGTIAVAANAVQLAVFTVTKAAPRPVVAVFGTISPLPTSTNEDDVIALTPSGASGSAVPMHFSIAVRAA